MMSMEEMEIRLAIAEILYRACPMDECLNLVHSALKDNWFGIARTLLRESVLDKEFERQAWQEIKELLAQIPREPSALEKWQGILIKKF